MALSEISERKSVTSRYFLSVKLFRLNFVVFAELSQNTNTNERSSCHTES